MKRITDDEHDINSPQLYDEKFTGVLGVWDMERHYKLAKYFKGGKYLDLGCFDSIMPILMAERLGTEVWAVDYAPLMIEFLQKRFPHVHYLCENIAKRIPFDNESFDYVVAGELIEHLKDPVGFISECMRVLKPGGYLAISTPFEARIRATGDEVGGDAHLWQWDTASIEKLLNTKETEIIQESNTQTILAWKRK